VAGEQQTTETLRRTLFACIEAVKDGRMEPNEARAVGGLADKIIQTAKLEMEYAQTLSEIDRSDTGVSPGPMLLANAPVGDGK
jgi:hypothetical protein